MNPAFGRHDKVEITLEGTVISPDDESFQSLARVQHRLPNQGQNIFCAPEGRPGSRILQSVAKGWLFSGDVRYVRGSSTQRHVYLRLSLNPTRFAAHAGRFNPAHVADLTQIERRELLRIDPAQETALENAALTDWDNYIPGLGRWITQATVQWEDLIRLYVEAVTSLIVEDFDRRSEERYPFGVERPTLTLRAPTQQVPQLHHVETYFEFTTDDARLSFAALERSVRTGAPNFEATIKYKRDGRNAAARWIAFDLRNGVTIKVYQKLRQRLRIEVTYAGSKRSVGDLLHTEFQFNADLPFLDRLERFRQDGARRVNTFLQGLPNLSMNEAADKVKVLADLFAEIARHAGRDQDLIRDIFSQLVTDRAITAQPRTNLQKIAKALTKAGVMERVSFIERSTLQRYVLLEPAASSLGGFCEQLVPK